MKKLMQFLIVIFIFNFTIDNAYSDIKLNFYTEPKVNLLWGNAPLRFGDSFFINDTYFTVAGGRWSETPENYYSSMLGPVSLPINMNLLYFADPFLIGIGGGYGFEIGDVKYNVLSKPKMAGEYEKSKPVGTINGKFVLHKPNINLTLGITTPGIGVSSGGFWEIRPAAEGSYVVYNLELAFNNLNYDLQSNNSTITNVSNFSHNYLTLVHKIGYASFWDNGLNFNVGWWIENDIKTQLPLQKLYPDAESKNTDFELSGGGGAYIGIGYCF